MRNIFVLLFCVLPFHFYAQNWKLINENELHLEDKQIQANHYLIYELDFQKLKNDLQGAPNEEFLIAEKSNYILEIPFPDGNLRKFKVSESPILPKDLSQKYPEIKTFTVRGLDDPYASGRIDYTYKGFHAMIQTLEGTLFIDPYNQQTQNYYLVYWRHDFVTDKIFQCLINDNEYTSQEHGFEKTNSNRAVGATQRKYRLAVCATVEYTNFHGGTKSDALSAITTTVNRVNQCLNRDFAIQFELVSNNDR